MAGASAPAQEIRSEDGAAAPEYGDAIDASTFEQILEMDDDEEDREFSKSIVFDFFTQAENTFTKMQTCLKEKDLTALSGLGHFLKGSSATLGLTKLKDSCEKIQHYGSLLDETGSKPVDDEDLCLERCKTTIKQAEEEFREAEVILRKFFGDE